MPRVRDGGFYTMKWSNLKLNKCPKCNADLTSGPVLKDVLIFCTKCDFRITNTKMELILTSMNKQNSKRESEEQIESFYRN